jgi:hypothetical protein
MSGEGDKAVDVLSMAQVTGGLGLMELLTRLGRDQPELALLQVAGEVKAGNVSVSFASSGDTVFGDNAELRGMDVREIANRLRNIDPESVVVDATERSYRLR